MKLKIEEAEWQKRVHINVKEKRFEGVMQRDYVIERAEFDPDNNTVELAFSSEAPVDRWFGTEILEHSKEAVNLDRLNAGGAVLVNHDRRDQVGVVFDNSARVDKDKVARASVLFSDSIRGQDIERDVKRGIRRLVSVGYRVDLFEVEERKGMDALYTAKEWTPLEISIVPIPADETVGVGRELEDETKPEVQAQPAKRTEEEKPKERKIEMKDENGNEIVEKKEIKVDIDLKAVTNKAKKEERERQAAIMAIQERFEGNGKIKELCQKAIKEEREAGIVGLEALELVDKAGKISPEAAEREANVGLSKEEIEKYSIHRAIRQTLAGTLDGLEGEVQRALEAKDKLGVSGRANAFYLPREVQTRAVQVTTSGPLGGFIVQDQTLSIIELLRNKMMVKQLGATVLTGMKGNVVIPKVDGASTAFWVSEDEATTQSNVTLGQLALNPKTISGNIAISRTLAMQSDPSAEALFSNDLAKELALAQDLAAISGTGTDGQPTGILNTDGIGTTTTATVTWDKMLAFEEDVALANADMATLAFLTNPTVRRILKKTEKATNTAKFIWVNKMIDEYRAEVTNQVDTDTVLFGDWAQLLIAEWGNIELQVITQGTNHRAGQIEIDAFQSLDLGVRQPGAFSVSTDFAA